jgi:AcrR family transcriptional regulator
MGARAKSTAQTRDTILRAARQLFFSRYYSEVSLREVAEDAGVTEQTVLRHFGSKEGLLEALPELMKPDIDAVRDQIEPGDLEGAARVVAQQYEAYGDGLLRALADEERVGVLAQVLPKGRESHRAWCERTFAPLLPSRRSKAYARRVTLFVAATDVYTWKLLRRDAGLSPAQTQRGIVELLEALAGRVEEGNDSR